MSETHQPSAAHRFARRIVGLYPAAWRERYQDEILALIDQTERSWRMTLDLAAGAVREWAHFIANPPGQGAQLRRALTLRSTLRLMLSIALPIAVMAISRAVAKSWDWEGMPGSWRSAFDYVSGGCFVTAAIRAVVVMLRARRAVEPGSVPGSIVSLFELSSWWLLIVVAATIQRGLGAASTYPLESISWFAEFTRWWIFGNVMIQGATGAARDAILYAGSFIPGEVDVVREREQARRVRTAERLMRFYSRTPPPEER
jgi:hypothetical protein